MYTTSQNLTNAYQFFHNLFFHLQIIISQEASYRSDYLRQGESRTRFHAIYFLEASYCIINQQ
jgi:hypothetical protein